MLARVICSTKRRLFINYTYQALSACTTSISRSGAEEPGNEARLFINYTYQALSMCTFSISRSGAEEPGNEARLL